MKYAIEFYFTHEYDVAYGEFSREEKLYTNELEAITDAEAIKKTATVMDELFEYKNKFCLDGKVVAKRLRSIVRIDQEKRTTNIAFY